MIELKIGGSGRFEQVGSYSRVRRVGAMVYVAGTTAVEPSGKLHAPGDTYRQASFIFDRIHTLLIEVGAGFTDVVRTRAYLSELDTASDYARAHGETFAAVDPVATAVGAGLTVPGMMVEVELDAIIREAENAT